MLLRIIFESLIFDNSIICESIASDIKLEEYIVFNIILIIYERINKVRPHLHNTSMSLDNATTLRFKLHCWVAQCHLLLCFDGNHIRMPLQPTDPRQYVHIYNCHQGIYICKNIMENLSSLSTCLHKQSQ